MNFKGFQLALYSNFAHFHAKNECVLAKKWRSIQDLSSDDEIVIIHGQLTSSPSLSVNLINECLELKATFLIKKMALN